LSTRNYPLLISSLLLALIVGAGGIAKLLGVPQAHTSFSILGLPEWFGYFIGACELLGAVALFIRPLSALSAAGIAVIMLGAIYFHVMHTPLIQAIPAIIALALSVYIFITRRSVALKFNSL
jgi:putative oxidoreductase